MSTVLGPVSTLDRWREESLYLDFVSGDPIDERLTTVRASEAARWNENGMLEFVKPNTPRIDFDPITRACRGLLVEEARTNAYWNSEYQGANANNTLVRHDSAIAPDGTLTADYVIAAKGTTEGEHFSSDRNFPFVAGSVYTFSAFVKDGPSANTSFYLRVAGSGNNFGLFFNPRTKAVSISATGNGSTSYVLHELNDGWFRLCMTFTAAATATSVLRAQLAANFSTTIYAGDNASGLYVWGLQLETGAFATSYIRTLPQFQSRASTATYFDAQGVMRTAAANAPRYSHGYVDGRWVPTGLLVEPAAQNVMGFSSDMGVANKFFANVTVDAAIAPDGTQTADRVYETADTGEHAVQRSFSGGGTAGDIKTGSAFVKADGRNRIRFRVGRSPTLEYVLFDLASKTVVEKGANVVSAGVLDCGNGWLRVYSTVTLADTNGAQYITFSLDNGTTYQYAGNGTAGIIVWGMQVEVGATLTSYIPTTNVVVTRAADVAPSASVTRAGDNVAIPTAGWYKESEGALVLDAEFIDDPMQIVNQQFALFSNGTASSYHGMLTGGGPTTRAHVIVRARTNGGTSADSYFQLNTTKNYAARMAFAYKTGQYAGASRGVVTNGPSDAIPPSVDRLNIGSGPAGNYGQGYFKRVAYYPRRIPNELLAQLTVR